MKRTLLIVAACGASAPPAVPPKSANTVDVAAALVPGYVTIVDFWSESCGACTVVAGMVAVQIAPMQRVVVRKVDVGDGSTALARAYDIGALPRFDVYDPRRRLRYVLVGSDCLRAPDLARALLAEP